MELILDYKLNAFLLMLGYFNENTTAVRDPGMCSGSM